MRKLMILQVACTAIMLLFGMGNASAFDVSHFTTQSKLATGKWVKISIPETGVYEITYDELHQMGFNNPATVRLYGFGGSRMNEILNGSAPDDLTPVPVMRIGNKICFYGNGPVRFTFTNYQTKPYFKRDFNAYSLEGYYFLTEESSTEKQIANKPHLIVSSYVDRPISYNFAYHERELKSYSGTGKDMLGEDFNSEKLFIDYELPDLADSTLNVYTTITADTKDGYGFVNAVIHSGGATDTTVYASNLSRLDNTSLYEEAVYSTASPYGYLKLTHPSEHGKFEPIITTNDDDFSTLMARLDYFILTYKRRNIIKESNDNQTLMAFALPKANDRFMLPNATATTRVWLITDPYTPMNMPLDSYNDATGQGYSFFATASSSALYVAFDPAKTLKKITNFEPVANQNLHALQTPHMLIITDPIFHEQAERLADVHRNHDGLDVTVVDQQEIFNEFSSGTRDPMAYRLLCKMLYDRNPSKFKYLLLFGTGTIDNRGMFGDHPGCLVTYQTDVSNMADKSYTSDDFFAILGDNSGANLSTDKLTIGVGRFTCVDADEAKSDVDKFIEYYLNPDYGVWRNRTLVFSDTPESGRYMFHGEGYKNQIDNELLTGMHVNTVHNSMYPRSTTQPNVTMDRKEATGGKHKLSELFKSGVFFATYVGHAGTTGFTKYNNMWTSIDVFNTSMPHLPILSTACCDVARYDSDLRGVADHMFHKRDGGAIALLTTSRMVYSDGNDMINRYFINALFSNATQGRMPTLGEAYVQCKHTFPEENSPSNYNKMSFFLLGDPAMKINYPVSRFNITKVNTTNMTSPSAMAQISPLMKFDIEACVYDANGNLDTGFNGDATVTLYDKEDFFVKLNENIPELNVNQDRNIYTDREKLAEIDGRVVNGVFRGQMIAPKSPEASNETVLLRVYAHKDNSTDMVNGFTKQITMLPYDENEAINDNNAPVINSMFINDETTFVNGAIVAPDAILYISATDDEGINLQDNSVDKDMTLLLDGGKVSYGEVSCFASPADGGKAVNVEFPLSNLTEGQHTLTFTVYDMLGHSATRTITFIVGQVSTANLVADKIPAYVNDVVNFDMESSKGGNGTFTVRVTDATGKLMWMTTTDSFPVTWDMKDMNGKKVPAGLYRYFGTYSNGTNYGGTPIKKLIVLDPVKIAAK